MMTLHKVKDISCTSCHTVDGYPCCTTFLLHNGLPSSEVEIQPAGLQRNASTLSVMDKGSLLFINAGLGRRLRRLWV